MGTSHCRRNPLAGASDRISPDGFRLLTNPQKKKREEKIKRKGIRTLQQIKTKLRLYPSPSKGLKVTNKSWTNGETTAKEFMLSIRYGRTQNITGMLVTNKSIVIQTQRCKIIKPIKAQKQRAIILVLPKDP